MIMARNEDGTYSQVGFVKDNIGIDTEYIYDKDGDIVFEKGFTRETSGTVPLTINGIGKDLKAWSITGNTVQNGTPTPENPVEVWGCGDRTANLFDNSLLEQGGWIASAGTIPTKLLPGETNYTRRTRYNQIIPLLASTLSLYCPANIKINYVWIDANGISLGGSGYQKNGDTATAPEQAVSMTFILGLDSDIECTPSDFSDINLVAGSIAPESYEPYGYKIPISSAGQITPVYLGEVETTRRIRKLVLTGKEGWVRTANRRCYYINLEKGCPADYLKSNIVMVMCSHYKGQRNTSSGSNEVNEGCICFFVGGGFELYIGEITITTAEEFKTYLQQQYAAGTPVTVWYVLATEKTAVVNEPLMKVGDYADTLSMEQAGVQIPTLNGTTVIDVDTAVKPTEMYTKYKSSK